MENQNSKMGEELLSLLREERYLYHQFRILMERAQELAETDSPEMLLEVINGRRKLTEKLRELNGKLNPIKANWYKLLSQIEPEHKMRAEEMVCEVRRIIGKIQAIARPENNEYLPLQREMKADELLAETLF